MIVALATFALAFADAKSQIEANYAKMATEYAAKRPMEAAKFMTPTYVSHELSGQTITLKQLLVDQRSQVAFTRDVEWTRKIASLQVSGDSALATVHATNRITLSLSKTGPADHIDVEMTLRDVWTRMGNSWLLASSQVLKRTALENGKPMHRGRG